MLFRCTRCLYPNLKPDIWFNDDGLCSACIAYDRRQTIDWPKRQDDFLALVNANRGSSHDVIVACSGGKDSTWQVLKCLELGLRPLAVTATTDHLSELGRKNLDNISNLCDHVEVTPHKPTRRKIAKFALQEVGDISWCEHHLIWSVPARESIARNIPIVLYGECPQNEMGAGPPGSESERMTKAWADDFGGLLGMRLSDVSEILNIKPQHLEIYRYPEEHESVHALFMGAFFPWDGYGNFRAAEANGFTPLDRDVEGSLGGFENLDNFDTGIHDRMRFLKFGYSRAVDIASNHIRRGRLSRHEAAEIVACCECDWPQTYLGKPYAEILEPLGVSMDEFAKICERFTNKGNVDWALSRASFRCFFGTNTGASKDGNSVKTAA